jgi:hypothetical protein
MSSSVPTVTAAKPSEQAVLFVDILGFAELTLSSEEYPVRVPPYEIGNWQEDYGAGAPNFWTEKSPISHRLVVFHRRLEEVLHKATRQGDLRAMLFSDGAYVVRPGIETMALLAGDIMRTCLLHRIPVRMGLAMGTFEPLKFGAETIGGTGIYTSLFYGTGVVRAYRAERESGKGMRIFVHPSAMAALPQGFNGIASGPYEAIRPGAFTPSAATGARPTYNLMPLLKPSEHASHELEYLHRRNITHWHHPPPDNTDAEDQKLWDAVMFLRSRAPLVESVQQHYIETIAALDAMRQLVGRPTFSQITEAP